MRFAYLDSPRLYNGVRLVSSPAPENVRRLDLGALPMINEMNGRGVYLDCGDLKTLSIEIRDQLEVLEYDIDEIAGRHINPESRDQVAPLVFHEMALHPPGGIKYTKGGKESTVDDVLSTIKEQHPIVPMILEHRGLIKILGTYSDKMPLLVDQFSRVHTTLSAVTAATGRLASSDPNLQNIPIKSAWGKRVRDSFKATPVDMLRRMGYYGQPTVLVAIDLSQIEMVWAAHLSQDPIMMDIFMRGDDIHTRTALAMMRLPESAACCLGKNPDHNIDGHGCPVWNEFKIKYRLPSKTLGFGILYGVTPKGLVLQIAAAGGPSWSVYEAEEFIAKWFDVYTGVESWTQDQYARARRYGMVWDAFGRIRYIPEVRSKLRGVVNAGLRQAGNQPVTASAQGSIKLAMAQVMDELVTEYQSYNDTICWPLLQIHDELLFELSTDIAEEFSQMVHDVMVSVVPLSVPVRAGIETGELWGDLK